MAAKKNRHGTFTEKRAAMKFGVIKQIEVVSATPAEVYQAYVDPKKHAAFTGTETTGTPKVGGRFTASDGYISGKYLSLEPGKKIRHEWTTTEWPTGYPPSIVELTLRPKDAETELTMVHSKVPAEQIEDYTEGWKEFYWRPLKKYFNKSSKPANKR